MLEKHLPQNDLIFYSHSLINFDRKLARKNTEKQWIDLTTKLRKNFDSSTITLRDYSLPSATCWKMVIDNPTRKLSYCYAISTIIPFYLQWLIDYSFDPYKILIDNLKNNDDQIYINKKIEEFFPNYQKLPTSLYSEYLPNITVFDRKTNKGRYIDIFFDTNIISDEGSGFDDDL